MRVLVLFLSQLLLFVYAEKLSADENKQLKSDCGELFDSTKSEFPSWLIPVQFTYDSIHKNQVIGVIISDRHVIVKSSLLLSGYKFKMGVTTEKQCLDAVKPSVKVAPEPCYHLKNCKAFRNPSAIKFLGTFRNQVFDGIFVLELPKGTYKKSPLCIPHEAEEFNLPNNTATVFNAKFPNSNGIVYHKIKKFAKKGNGLEAIPAEVGLGVVVNEFEGKSYLIGFHPPSGNVVVDHIKNRQARICGLTGVCKIDKVLTTVPPPPTTTTPTTTTEATTTPEPTTEEPTTEEPTTEEATTEQPTTTEAPWTTPSSSATPSPSPVTTRKLVPRITRKPMLPFEYEDSDYMHYPEETTKTAKEMGTFWVTVLLGVFLL